MGSRQTEKEEKLLNATDRAEETAYGSDETGELSRARSKSIDFYLGRNTRPAPEGRSQVVDRSVFETINWVLPSLIDIFANGDDVISIGPIGAEDEAGAKQEGQYLNHLMLVKNPWLEIIMTLGVDFLLTKNAYVYVYKDYKRNVSIDRYENQTAAGVQMLMDGGNVEILEQSSKPDPSGQQEPMVDPATGQPAMQIVGIDPMGQPIQQPVMQPVMLYDVVLRTVDEEGTFCIDVLPPERCKVSEKTKNFRLNTCPYFETWEDMSISDVRKMGFDIPDDINDQDTEDTEEDQARDQYDEQEDDEAYEPSMRVVRVRTIWIQHDYDEDGIAEMQKYLRIGRKVLHREEVSRIHVASTVAMPLPHRHIGLSIADFTMDLQEIKTALLRGGLDNLYLANNNRMAVSNKANIDDVLLSRPGQPIRVDTDMADVQGHVVPVITPFIFPQVMEGMAAVDQIKQMRTGVNSQFQGLDASQLGALQPGVVNQISSMAAQRVKLLARILGCCVEDIASILHEVVLKSGHKKETVKLSGKWVEVDPSQWKKRTDFKTSVGYAAGNKDAMMAKLTMITGLQEKALMGGMPIVTPENVYNAASDIVKASDFPPDRFFTEPSKVPPKGPPQPDVTVMAAEQMKTQSSEKIKGAELQQKDRETAATLELEKYKTDTDAKVKLTIAQSNFDHAKEMKHIEAEHSVGMEGVRAHLNPKMKEADAKVSEAKSKDTLVQGLFERVEKSEQRQEAMLAQVLAAVSSLNGPKKIIRDKGGKAIGVEPG